VPQKARNIPVAETFFCVYGSYVITGFLLALIYLLLTDYNNNRISVSMRHRDATHFALDLLKCFVFGDTHK
jgi:hypothetical protein